MSKANLSNEYFHSIFTISSYTLPPLHDHSQSALSLENIIILESDVYETLNPLDVNNAMGIDGIGTRILKLCAITHSTSFIHNQSKQNMPCLVNGSSLHYPNSQVCPVNKCPDKDNVHNYKPIALLCSTAKVQESITLQQSDQLVVQSISSSHFGFLCNRSSLQQLLVLFNSVHESVNYSLLDVRYFDFLKAFDRVPHKERWQTMVHRHKRSTVEVV